MGVTRLVPVEVFDQEPDLLGIMVNLKDYNVGADKGGETTLFDDFDLDYNQLKYLYETRVSGALTKLRSAVVVRRVAAALALAVPQKPAFANNTITIPTVTGVTYTVDGVLTAAGPHAITADAHVRLFRLLVVTSPTTSTTSGTTSSPPRELSSHGEILRTGRLR